MRHYSRNIMVFAKSNGNHRGFNVYLVFSGQREYLITHRSNGAMYRILKDGIRLGDLQRGIREMNFPVCYGRRACRTDTEQLWNSMRYLMVVIDDYIEDREQCA